MIVNIMNILITTASEISSEKLILFLRKNLETENSNQKYQSKGCRAGGAKTIGFTFFAKTKSELNGRSNRK